MAEQEQQKQENEPKTRKQRMTKKDVKQFVDWCFSDLIKDEIPKWRYGKIITEYENATGRKLSKQFISAQKKRWVLINENVNK